MIHQMKLSGEPFQKIKEGKKIIESRIFDEKRQQINTGDLIEFRRNDNSAGTVIVKVKALYRYPAFKELFSDFPASSFGGESREELLDAIHQFYSAEEEKKFGVIGIGFELADKRA